MSSDHPPNFSTSLEHLYLEPGVRKFPLGQEIMRSLRGCQVHEIKDHRGLNTEAVPVKGYGPRTKNKVLVLALHPGPFIRPFPGTSEKGGSREFYVAHANGCPFDCRYCFLQGYFDHGAPVLFVNQEELLQEMAAHLEQHGQRPGTIYHAGELSDALAMEPWSRFAARSIPLFRPHPSARLELRTKSTAVEAYLPPDPPENIIVSWTLTPPEAWKRYETGTPHPVQRLISARACQNQGYRIGIRLDPALLYPEWEQGYEALIREIFKYLRPEAIESFVVGGFRYASSLETRVRERFPACDLFLNEFVLCPDGKYRYFRPLRVRLYRKIMKEISKYDPAARVQLCMETSQVRQDLKEEGGALEPWI